MSDDIDWGWSASTEAHGLKKRVERLETENEKIWRVLKALAPSFEIVPTSAAIEEFRQGRRDEGQEG